MRITSLFGCILLSAVALANLERDLIVQELNSLSWDISNQNGSIAFTAGSLPLMVLEALVNAGQVTQGDPIAGYNDRNYQWVYDDTWIYETEFNITDEVEARENIDLVLEGVDTVAVVHVNNQLVGRLNNAHRKYRLPVKDAITLGSNLVSITFSPAPQYAKIKAAEYPYVAPFSPYPKGLANYNFIRKPASDFGWDWGPAFAPSGVYRSVSLEAYDVAFLTGASIRQEHHNDGQVDVYFRAVLNAPTKGEGGLLTVSDASGRWTGSTEVKIDKEGEAFAEVKVVIKDDYSLWWPIGFGQQVLYNFTVTYMAENNETGVSSQSSLGRRLGIRTMELVEDPLRDPSGYTFYFRVNGVPIYARGANLIPLQIFHSQNSRAGYQQLLEDAVDANMNMLRIWGGGLYQDDSLYDLADEMGILIWQEAMFACGPYPRDTDFLENVKAEVTYQAQRISHHASLAIWGGNNEVETSFAWYPESRSNPNLFSVDFNTLFVETIRRAILLVDKNIAFVDSSPSNGVYSTNPYVKRWGNPGDTSMGDVHFYDYSDNCLDLSTYPRAKFVSEYGFQSYPSFSVYKKYTTPPDWSVNSDMSAYRQRHPDGNSELQAQMQFHFKAIAYNATSDSLQTALFSQWIYLTQLQQSLCYEAAITNWRRLKAAPDARTMGVLYWQLNDVWAGPSWSGIDHGGHWKQLMYGIRRNFSPVLVSATYNSTLVDALSVYITNDQPWKVSGTAIVELIPWAGKTYDQPLVTQHVNYTVAALGSMVIKTIALKPLLKNASLALSEAVVRIQARSEGNAQELQAQSCVTADGDPFTTICTPAKGMAAAPAPPQNSFSPASSAMTTSNKRYDSHQVVWLTEPKAAIIPLNPKIQLASIKQLTDSIASLVLSCRGVAAAVQLDTDKVPGVFSDNGFLLVPWEQKTIDFTGRQPFDIADLRASLTFLSLADTLITSSVTAL